MQKVVFIDRELADTAHTLVKTLNNSLKNVFNETLTLYWKQMGRKSCYNISLSRASTFWIFFSWNAREEVEGE